MMLVLGRQAGDKIYLDGGIEIEVVRIKGNKVTLGFKAPKEVKIVRAEIAGREGKDVS